MRKVVEKSREQISDKSSNQGYSTIYYTRESQNDSSLELDSKLWTRTKKYYCIWQAYLWNAMIEMNFQTEDAKWQLHHFRCWKWEEDVVFIYIFWSFSLKNIFWSFKKKKKVWYIHESAIIVGYVFC